MNDQAIEPPDHDRIAWTRKVEHRLKLGSIIPGSTHHVSVGSFDGGFRQRIFLERGGLLTFGDAHISNLHSTISSHSFFSMVLVRLYGNSWKWYISRCCFVEWIIRIDQFEEMSRKMPVVHAETSRSGASGKRTVSRRRGAGVSLLTNCSIGFPHVLYPTTACLQIITRA